MPAPSSGSRSSSRPSPAPSWSAARSEIGTALLNAGVDTDRVTSTPDDVWTATREDGSQISFGCSRGDETGGWDYTEHDADDNVTMQDYRADAAQMAAHVADFLR
jgi:hypothetical protein